MRYLGISLAIFGALLMIINLYFLKTQPWYDVIRYISGAFFLLGLILTPQYVLKKRENRQP